MEEPRHTSEHQERNTKSRSWFFTLNNPRDTDKELIMNIDGLVEYGFQLECGANGTPHFQGFIRFKNARHFKKICETFEGRAHIEKVSNLGAARNYCKKKDTRIDGPWMWKAELVDKVVDPLLDKELLPWEIEIESILETPPDDRTIHWYFDLRGGCGKTTFCKHLVISREACYVRGKAADVKYSIAQMEEKPTIVLWDMPRSLEERMNYDGIEEIKNGLFFSGKYESSTVLMEIPHVFCFANWPPDTSKLSADRWHIVDLSEY